MSAQSMFFGKPSQLQGTKLDSLTGSIGEPADVGGDSVFRNGAPRPTKMGNVASPWRYDGDVKSASGTMFVRRGCQQRYADHRVVLTDQLWHIMP